MKRSACEGTDTNLQSKVPCCEAELPCCENEVDLPCCDDSDPPIDQPQDDPPIVESIIPVDPMVDPGIPWIGQLPTKTLQVQPQTWIGDLYEPKQLQPDTSPCQLNKPPGYVRYPQMTPGIIMADWNNAYDMWPVNGYHGTWHLTRATLLSSTVSKGTQRQDPDGIHWIPQSNWKAAEWDCVPRSHCKYTKMEMQKWLFPDNNTMRGLRERFYEVNPFTDVNNPTIAEIDSWNVEVINHFRRLLGLKNTATPLRSLFKRAYWASEAYAIRRFVQERQIKNEKGDVIRIEHYYTSKGVCPKGQKNAHCKAGYLPACGMLDYPSETNEPGQDHPAYKYPDETDWSCIKSVPGNQAEDIVTTKTNLPWSIKMSRVILQFIASDGFCGHTGPFLIREHVGVAFHVVDYNPEATIVRVKWSGSKADIGDDPCCFIK